MIDDHLSRLEKTIEEEKGSELEENFINEQLFLLSVQRPWYADIANYLACGLIDESKAHLFLIHFSGMLSIV